MSQRASRLTAAVISAASALGSYLLIKGESDRLYLNVSGHDEHPNEKSR
ncbi:hypothetical protein [Streptosporangium sandarakinum]